LCTKAPLRQTEGFVGSVLGLMGVSLDAPDHTTLSRRGRQLDVELHRTRVSDGPIHLIVDSTGLEIVGQGQWAAVKHGGKGIRGWRKLHLGVDATGVIVAEKMTDSTIDDATVVGDLLDQIDADVGALHRGRSLRQALGLRCPHSARRDGRGSAIEDCRGVGEQHARRTGSRCDSSARPGCRTTPMEEGVWVPPSGEGRERLLQVQAAPRSSAPRSPT